MSKFSGKCDFYDFVEMIGGPDELHKYTIYIKLSNGEYKKLQIDNALNVVPYYPHIISRSYGKTVYLSEQSYVKTMIEKYGYSPLIYSFQKSLAEEYLKEYQNIKNSAK